MQMAQRIPELEAPAETRESPSDAAAHRSDTDTPEPENEPQRPQSWWRRFFGFE